jgi:chaperonin GroEL (HSP60 family)
MYVSDRVRSTLGPLGMDKMLTDKLGNRVLTNDGATILKSLPTKDPIALEIVDVAKAQEQKAYDGTTTSVILVGELLLQADILIEKGVHPTAIAKGYREAQAIAIQEAENKSEKLGSLEAAKKVAITAMTGKTAGGYAEHLSEICAQAATCSKPHNIKIIGLNGDLNDSKIIDGVVVIKEPCLSGMPTKLEGSVLLVDEELGPPMANINLSDPSKIAEIAKVQEQYIKERISHILKLDIKAVFCQKGIDSRAQQAFRREGIMAFRNIKKGDMHRLATTTGASIVEDLADIRSEDIGEGKVEFVENVSKSYTKVEGKIQGAASIILPCPTEQTLQEISRALEDAIGVAWIVANEPSLVVGAGTVQAQMHNAIINSKPSLDSKAEVAKHAYAKSLLIIPQTLAESAGMDIMDSMHELLTGDNLGIDAINASVSKMTVVEPLEIVRSAL